MNESYQERREERLRYAREYLQKHKEKIHEYQKAYRARKGEHLSAYRRDLYRRNGRNRKPQDFSKISEWKANNPEKVKIHAAVYRALKRGEIIKPEYCARCGQRARLSCHHFNYLHFMNFIWLCSSCHKKEHNISNN